MNKIKKYVIYFYIAFCCKIISKTKLVKGKIIYIIMFLKTYFLL